jgi:TolB-like protein
VCSGLIRKKIAAQSQDPVNESAISAIFISYASADGTVATAVCQALEGAGLMCWIAPRDVRAGDFYADAIVQAINSCTVLVLVQSRSAVDSPHVLREVERASAKRRPIIAMRTDSTPLPPGLEYFLSASHWLDASKTPINLIFPSLIEAVRSHQASVGHLSTPTTAAVAPVPAGRTRARWAKRLPALAAVVGAAVLLYLLADKLWLWRHSAPPVAQTAVGAAWPAAAAATAVPAFSPPAHSIAVLPFVNMSGDPKQDYFSDGLSEELLNSLAAVRELQVAARTSAFSFKGRQVDVAEIGRTLNVGTVLEGSVRKEGEHVRITAQLINVVTGFHLWSKTYDRDLKSVLKLQTEVATEVSAALKATLLTTADAPLDSGGTENPQAFDAYLRGQRFAASSAPAETLANVVAAYAAAVKEYSEAIRLDPQFANAYLNKAYALLEIQRQTSDTGPQGRKAANEALLAAGQATALAPRLGAAHAALAEVQSRLFFEFASAQMEYERALALSPGDARVLTHAALFLAQMGRYEEAVPHAQRAAMLDPLNAATQFALADFFYAGHRYRESIEAAARAIEINPRMNWIAANQGISYLATGNTETALQTCIKSPNGMDHKFCLAILYYRLERRTEAEAALASLQAEAGDAWAYQYAEVYAQWGDVPKALASLETAYRLFDPGLLYLRTDELIDSLRQEARFRAIYAKMNFPN